MPLHQNRKGMSQNEAKKKRRLHELHSQKLKNPGLLDLSLMFQMLALQGRYCPLLNLKELFLIEMFKSVVARYRSAVSECPILNTNQIQTPYCLKSLLSHVSCLTSPVLRVVSLFIYINQVELVAQLVE